MPQNDPIPSTNSISNYVAWRLLYTVVAAIAALFLVQFASNHRIDPDPLTYLIPGCIVSYLFGRRDALRERNREPEQKKA